LHMTRFDISILTYIQSYYRFDAFVTGQLLSYE